MIDALAFSKQLIILTNLGQSDSGIHISHIDFHTLSHDVVTPTASLTLGECILGLAVECHEPHLLVELFVIKRFRHIETDHASFCCSDVFDSMQGEYGDICLGASMIVVVSRS